MTVRDLINELNALVADGDATMDSIVVNAEGDNIFSICEGMSGRDEVVIYF